MVKPSHLGDPDDGWSDPPAFRSTRTVVRLTWVLQRERQFGERRQDLSTPTTLYHGMADRRVPELLEQFRAARFSFQACAFNHSGHPSGRIVKMSKFTVSTLRVKTIRWPSVGQPFKWSSVARQHACRARLQVEDAQDLFMPARRLTTSSHHTGRGAIMRTWRGSNQERFSPAAIACGGSSAVVAWASSMRRTTRRSTLPSPSS